MKEFIRGKEYIYTTAVKDQELIRKSFNELAQQTFGGLSFEGWYQNGFWDNNCIPHVLLDGDKVVSAVLVNIIHTKYANQEKLYIQLGTVMTAVEYRNKGLSSWLIEKVLKEWKDKCDAVYLYANDSVLRFYPKYSFIRAKEYQYTRPISKKTLGQLSWT